MKKLISFLATLIFGIGITTADTGGALSGKFTINEFGEQICFSSGNLQYDPQSKKFHFASTQYEILGTKNSEVLDAIDADKTISGCIDLFGWGTGTNPTLHKESAVAYSTFYDWGDNLPSNEGKKWRTLSMEEWSYLLSGRDRADELFGLGSVNGVNGFIFLPDDWQTPASLDFKPSMTKGLAWDETWWCYRNNSNNNFDHNTYSSEEWTEMESAGAVFLPVTGRRSGTNVSFLGQGYYWSSSPYDSEEESSSDFFFDKTNVASTYIIQYGRSMGMAVRLVECIAKPEAEIYTVFEESPGTLTYYYDMDRTKHEGVTERYDPSTYPESWHFRGYTEKVKKVVIDPSMKDAPLIKMDGMFCGFHDYKDDPLYALTTIEGLENLNTSKVKDMSNLFKNCSALTSLDLSSFNTAEVTNMREMFKGCSALTLLDLSSFNTANVEDMYRMFQDCVALTSLDLSSFNTANVTDMGSMFDNCVALTSLDISSFETYNVTEMSEMFQDCSSLKTIYCNNDWSTNHPGSFHMFSYCTSLVGGKGTAYNSSSTDITYARPDGGTNQPGYFTKNKKEVYTVFAETTGTLTYYYDDKQALRSGIKEVYDPVNNPDAARFTGYNKKILKAVIDKSMKDAHLTSTYSMFFGGINSETYAFQTLHNMTEIKGMENLNTANVTRMDWMFEACNSLQTIDVSTFDVSKVTKMDYMFGDCYKLTTIYCNKDWSNTTASSFYMFSYCTSLVGGEGTTFDSEVKDATYARPDGGEYKPGYFTKRLYAKGDVDRNGVVNSADVVAIYNFILSGEAETGISKAAADVDGNGEVNSADIVAVYNIIIGGE